MDGWMICDFTSFSTVFKSYQDNERLIMKDLSEDQRLTYQATGAPIFLELLTLANGFESALIYF